MRSTPAIQQSLWFVVLVSALLASLATSWMLHKPVDYGYGFWYDQMDIRGHIDHYGPKNTFVDLTTSTGCSTSTCLAAS